MSVRTVGVFSASVLLGVSGLAVGAVPEYERPVSLARSQFGVGVNVPPGSSLVSRTPDINDAGLVAVTVSNIPAGDDTAGGLFYGQLTGGTPTGSLVWTSAPGAFISSDVSINNAGQTAFSLSFASPNGVYRGTPDGQVTFVTNQPLGASSFSGVKINDAGQIAYRASVGSGYAYISWSAGTTATHATSVQVDPASPYNFLFTPAFNNQRQIAARVRLGAADQTTVESQPDQIRIFNADGTSTLIAEDRDSNPASPYIAFDSSAPGFNNNGEVAFFATIESEGGVNRRRALFVSDGTTTRLIADPLTRGWASMSLFPPSINDNGLVAFRVDEASGIQSVFVGDGNEVRLVARRFDIVDTDLGELEINASSLGTVALGGAPAINCRGDVAFGATVTLPGTLTSRGNVLLVARASQQFLAADFNQDGVVNTADITAYLSAWFDARAMGTTGRADFNQDGVVNTADITAFLSAWFEARAGGGTTPGC